jgi:hypothetical protein
MVGHPKLQGREQSRGEEGAAAAVRRTVRRTRAWEEEGAEGRSGNRTAWGEEVEEEEHQGMTWKAAVAVTLGLSEHHFLA